MKRKALAFHRLARTLQKHFSTNDTFNRGIKVIQRSRAAAFTSEYDYLRTELAQRLVDRLDDIQREKGFPLALDIGAGAGYIHKAICADESFIDFSSEEEEDNDNFVLGGIGGVQKLVQIDSCEHMLRRDEQVKVEGMERCETYRLVVPNEEKELPFPDETFDLVLSCASLHWVNDLPRLFNNIHRVLKPDACFMCVMIGGSETLVEMRSSLVLAEMERAGGVRPHVGPFINPSDVGSLLTNAGFSLPTVDVDTVNLAYPNAFVLMEHIQRMGESNALVVNSSTAASTPTVTSLDTFLSSACIYQDMFPLEQQQQSSEDEAAVSTTVQAIYAIGWKPHESQQKPLQRGTATQKFGSIKDVVVTQTNK